MWKRQRGPCAIFTLVEAASCRDAHLRAPACVLKENDPRRRIRIKIPSLFSWIIWKDTLIITPARNSPPTCSGIRHKTKHINASPTSPQSIEREIIPSAFHIITSSRCFYQVSAERAPSLQILQPSANQPAILRYVSRKSQHCELLVNGRQIPGTYWCVSSFQVQRFHPPLRPSVI